MKKPTFSLQLLLCITLVIAAYLYGSTAKERHMRAQLNNAEQLAEMFQTKFNESQTKIRKGEAAWQQWQKLQRERKAPKAPEEVGLGEHDVEVKLTFESGEERHVNAYYSFFHLSLDDPDNNWDLQVLHRTPRNGGYLEDYFEAQGQWGQILDLGKVAIAEIESRHKRPGWERDVHPSNWFEGSTAFDSLRKNPQTSRVKIVENHSYVLRRLSRSEFVVAAFHVKEYKPEEYVVLDQIEVFQKSAVEPIPLRMAL